MANHTIIAARIVPGPFGALRLIGFDEGRRQPFSAQVFASCGTAFTVATDGYVEPDTDDQPFANGAGAWTDAGYVRCERGIVFPRVSHG